MIDMSLLKNSLATLAAWAVVLCGYAGEAPGPGANTIIRVNPGTNAVIVVPPGANTITLVTQGTNAVVILYPGTNAVTLVTPGTNAAVQVRLGTNAMVQVRPAGAPPKTNGWNSLVAAGLTLTRGNSDTLLFTAKIATQKKDDRNEWLFQADGAYGVNNSVNSADSLHGLGQNNHLFSEKFYTYANADVLHDGIQDLKYRVSLSPGAGYYLIKTNTTLLSVEMGPGLVTEERGDTDETYMSLRMAEHWEHKLSPTAKLWEKVEILPQINKFDNYAANIEFGVDSAITRQLSLQVTFDDNYVNEPAAGRKSNDVKLVGGIAWKF